MNGLSSGVKITDVIALDGSKKLKGNKGLEQAIENIHQSIDKDSFSS